MNFHDSIFFLFKTFIATVICSCHGFDNSWDPSINFNNHNQKIPQEVMIDAVNTLAFKLLAIHNENNSNNIAISPYGAITVLIAMQEGTTGEAAEEIQWATSTPPDISIVRVGLRDIHRHLKSYFIPEEGFLSGLTFSNSNVTLKSDYKQILQFYGFDISSFNTAFYPEIPSTIQTVPPIIAITTTEDRATKEDEITTSEIKDEVTTVLIDITSTFPSFTTLLPTTNQLDTEFSVENSNTLPSITSTLPLETTAKTERIETSTSSESSTITTPTVPESTSIASTVGSTEATSDSTLQNDDLNVDDVITTPTTESSQIREVETTEISSLTDMTPPNLSRNEIFEEKKRDKRSVVDYIIARYYDDHSITPKPPSTPQNNINNYLENFDLKFLVDDKYPESNISFMTYDTILPYHYSQHLHTLALRFPLDSTKYYLLLLLPDKETHLDQVICNLRLNTDLKYIINNLKFTHVRAQIPSFMLKGYVVLTSTLQKMGINKVFEPRQADFSKMTDDKNIYVTNVEQAITVTIRNYMEPGNVEEYKYMYEDEPVYFTANRPFLYFVIDSEIHVTLMAGKITNPLNSRIR